MGSFRKLVVKALILGSLAACVVAEPALAWCCSSRYPRRLSGYGRVSSTATNKPTGTTGGASTGCKGITISPGDDVAAVMASHGAGTDYCFEEGTHRLSAPIEPERGDSLMGAPGAVLSGAKVLSGWQASGDVWTASIGSLEATKTDWSGSTLLNPESVYEQDLFLGGTELTKIGVRDGGQEIGDGAGEVGPGEYFVDYDADTVYLGTDPSGRTAEMSVVAAGIDSSASDVVVASLTIEKFAGPGIETAGGTGWTIDRNEIRFNHTRALKVYGNGKVTGNFVHHNGQYGLTGTGENNLFDGNEVAFNNAARFARSTESFWDAGATKFVRNTGLAFRNNYVHDNFGDGIWIDIDNTNVTVSGNRVEGNSRIGINYEISGAGTIENNTVKDNGYVGIWVNSSRDVRVVGNRVERNYHSIVVVQQDRGSDYITSNVEVAANTIVDSGVTGTRDTTGATFKGNTYRVSDLTSKLWQWDSKLVDAAGWKALGSDLTGVFVRL